MHLLNSKRRGRNLPIGLPLHIKEEFMQSTTESKAFVRPVDNSRAVGTYLTNDELELESKRLDREIELLSNSNQINFTVDLDELNQLKNYKKDQVSQLRLELEQEKKAFENCQPGNNQEISELLAKLLKEKEELEQSLKKFEE